MVDFLTKSNVQLLWEVLMDEDILYSKPPHFINHIMNHFNNNLIPFYENEKKINEPTIQNLFFYNKKYISFMIDAINKLENTLHIQNEKQKQTLDQNKNKKQLITNEEIQEERKSNFERDLNKKQEEFQRAVALPVPPTPKFSDTFEEEKPPMSELEKRIQQTIAERNFDLENRNYGSTADTKKASQWLNSQETSVKKDKIKYIRIEEPLIKENVIHPVNLNENAMENTTKQPKHIQWSENLEESFPVSEYYYSQVDSLSVKQNVEKYQNTNATIFSKLKMIPQNPLNELSNKDIKIQQLEEEVQGLYKKIDEMAENIVEIKKMILSGNQGIMQSTFDGLTVPNPSYSG